MVRLFHNDLAYQVSTRGRCNLDLLLHVLLVVWYVSIPRAALSLSRTLSCASKLLARMKKHSPEYTNVFTTNTPPPGTPKSTTHHNDTQLSVDCTLLVMLYPILRAYLRIAHKQAYSRKRKSGKRATTTQWTDDGRAAGGRGGGVNALVQHLDGQLQHLLDNMDVRRMCFVRVIPTNRGSRLPQDTKHPVRTLLYDMLVHKNTFFRDQSV